MCRPSGVNVLRSDRPFLVRRTQPAEARKPERLVEQLIPGPSRPAMLEQRVKAFFDVSKGRPFLATGEQPDEDQLADLGKLGLLRHEASPSLIGITDHGDDGRFKHSPRAAGLPGRTGAPPSSAAGTSTLESIETGSAISGTRPPWPIIPCMNFAS